MFATGQIILLDHESVGRISVASLIGFDIDREADIGTYVIVRIRSIVIYIIFRITICLHCVSNNFSSWIVFGAS